MLQVTNLDVYYGESKILKNVSIDVPVGKVICLMGRNGVGKTTLLKSVMGVLKPRAGSIMLDGIDVTKKPPNMRARAGIGYVPQGRGIFPFLTVLENLQMGLEALADRKSGDANLLEVYEIFPVLRDMRGRVAGTLSGGQQQQLSIGRALIRKPRLLILDEPTEGIQPSIMHDIENVILNLGRSGELSILLVEQFLDFALRVADRYYVMETGKVVAGGEVSNFDESVVKEYLAV